MSFEAIDVCIVVKAFGMIVKIWAWPIEKYEIHEKPFYMIKLKYMWNVRAIALWVFLYLY